MIEFILNKRKITTEMANGVSLLDFIRKECHLPGTKTGCREGDCGACTVMEGRLYNGVLKYKSIVSCLTPLINVHGKHIVTIEGLGMDELSPVQQSIISNGATQCGFCTPGVTVSLTSHLLAIDQKDPLQSIGGNICRCTGYKSIEKAAHEVDDLKNTIPRGNELKSIIEKGWLPKYFSTIQQRLSEIEPYQSSDDPNGLMIGGGTDLMVQQYKEIRQTNIVSTEGRLPDSIEIEGGKIIVGGGVTMQSFFNSQVIRSEIPQLEEVFPLIASEQIRNMGTLAGNIVNASPIGDLSILLLALDAELILENRSGISRQVKLCNFSLDYKLTDLKAGEIIKFIVFKTLKEGGQIGFEKVSKRTYLDIASVNSSISIVVENSTIAHFSYSVGGIAPVPKYMFKTKAFLSGKKLDIVTLKSALEIIQTEISPISDIRGSKEYKRLLVRQLFLQHFLTMFPKIITPGEIHMLMTNKQIPHEKH